VLENCKSGEGKSNSRKIAKRIGGNGRILKREKDW
jgi:hypothetical protein